jgi:hypothetical protein
VDGPVASTGKDDLCACGAGFCCLAARGAWRFREDGFEVEAFVAESLGHALDEAEAFGVATS